MILGITTATANGTRTIRLMRRALTRAILLVVCATVGLEVNLQAATTNSFVNFETAPVHPVAISPDGRWLAVCNLPDARLELFDVTSGIPVSTGSVMVGLDPVTVRFRTS